MEAAGAHIACSGCGCHTCRSLPIVEINPTLSSTQGVCLLSGKVAVCQPPNPCGSVNGNIDMRDRAGTFSDTYDKYPALVSCDFYVDARVPTPLREYAQLVVTILRVQLG